MNTRLIVRDFVNSLIVNERERIHVLERLEELRISVDNGLGAYPVLQKMVGAMEWYAEEFENACSGNEESIDTITDAILDNYNK